MEITLENCIGLRLAVESLSPLRISNYERGLICIGVGKKGGMPALLALCDPTDCYEGIGATRSASVVLSFLEHHWRLRMAVRKCNLVLLDQYGTWHHLGVRWNEGTGIDWIEPVRWPEREPGSEDAFNGAFGGQASRTLGVLEEMVGGDLVRFGYAQAAKGGS